MKNKYQKNISKKSAKEFHTPHGSLRTGNLPLYSGPPSLRVDILTLCSRLVPSSIVVTYLRDLYNWVNT